MPLSFLKHPWTDLYFYLIRISKIFKVINDMNIFDLLESYQPEIQIVKRLAATAFPADMTFWFPSRIAK